MLERPGPSLPPVTPRGRGRPSPRLVRPSGVPAALLRPAPPLERPFAGGGGLSREMGSPAATSSSGALLVDELAHVACRRLGTADIATLRGRLGAHLLLATEGQHAATMHASMVKVAVLVGPQLATTGSSDWI